MREWRNRVVCRFTVAVLLALGSAVGARAQSRDVKIAVAANFAEPIKQIGAAFEKATGNKLVLSFGATGQFYAQITQGAPFDVLVSADQATPAKAISEGHAVAGSAFTYSVGKLVLYSKTLDVSSGDKAMRDGKFGKIAIANPATAPYGAAAIETLTGLGLLGALRPKFVQGNNIAQTFQFVDTGNAEAGFVALSQVIFSKGGSRWLVPSNLHSPIAQDAVLLKAGANNAGAKAFLAFLRGPAARSIIEKFGYGVGE